MLFNIQFMKFLNISLSEYDIIYYIFNDNNSVKVMVFSPIFFIPKLDEDLLQSLAMKRLRIFLARKKKYLTVGVLMSQYWCILRAIAYEDFDRVFFLKNSV